MLLRPPPSERATQPDVTLANSRGEETEEEAKKRETKQEADEHLARASCSVNAQLASVTVQAAEADESLKFIRFTVVKLHVVSIGGDGGGNTAEV